MLKILRSEKSKKNENNVSPRMKNVVKLRTGKELKFNCPMNKRR